MAIVIYAPWSSEPNIMADKIHETTHYTHSDLLGPDGRPLAYRPKDPVGYVMTTTQRQAASKG
ncbi:MAG: hypothetical protein H7317_05390 [Pseudorhodobacter sp.]|nr:hypothetical protein [Pseudorhodobacter sp.]